MRKKLWPDCPEEKHDKELNLHMSQPENYQTFIAIDLSEKPVGFIEASVHKLTPGCHTSPVGYIEGWFVEEEYRKIGIGKLLMEAVETWAIEYGYLEIASDVEINNVISIEVHKSLGYKETYRTDIEVKFLKELLISEIVFGKENNDIEYIERVGIYSAVLNSNNKVALLKNAIGYFLPGGRMDSIENYKDCLERKIIEESGYKVTISILIGKASQYHYSDTLKEYLHDVGYFYIAKIDEKVEVPIETDHFLVWVTLEEAEKLLFLEHQKWAVEMIIKVNNPV